MSLRSIIITMILAMTAAFLGIIAFTMVRQHTDETKQAVAFAREETARISSEQRVLMSGAEQLAITLSHTAAVRNHDAREVSRLLREIVAGSSQYGTIFLLDASGRCWAAALPEQLSLSYADRRYVRNALSTGRFSSGEFTVGKVLQTPIFSFGYPVKNQAGVVTDVIAVTIKLDRYRQIFDRNPLKSSSNVVLTDHKGSILYASNDQGLIGSQDSADLLRRMQAGPGEGSFEAPGVDNIRRHFVYNRLLLPGEQAAYMYVRTGVSKHDLLVKVRKSFAINLGALASVMALMLLFAIAISKRQILDKVAALQEAAHRIARGDFDVKVSEQVKGGELGELGLAFDAMSRQLSLSIAEQRQAELALQNREEEFRLIFEGASDAIFWADAETGILLNCNRAAELMLEAPRSVIIGKHQTTLHPAELLEETAATFRKAAADPLAFPSTEAIVLSHSGKWIPVEITHAVTRIADKATIQGIFRDITERKLVEEAMRKKTELLDLARDAIIVRDLDGTVRFWNHGAQEMYGYPPEQAMGSRTHELLRTIFPNDIGEIQEILLRDGYWEGQLTHTTSSGNCIKVASRWVLQRKDDGQILRVLEINTDITEHEKLQLEMLKVQKLESLGVLAGGIAHDFNNVLTGILGNISFARMFLDDSHRASKILLEAEKASQRATDLAYQLLTFAKGSQPIKKALSVRQILNASTSLVLRGSNVKCLIELPEGLKAIEADEGQLSQACNNIIINAAQAMPGGGTITMRGDNVTLDESNPLSLAAGEYVRLNFADTGCGISEEDQKRIFDPYFTTKSRGSGLGLASVHSIVAKHGGHISVRSQAGVGTTFELLLPASQAAASEPEADRGAAPARGQRGTRLLVMDDEEIIRSLTSEMLGELGYEVQTCINGEQAVVMYGEALQAGMPFGAVIMDLTVPGGMGGKEAAVEILKLDPAARLIVSSGYSNDPVMANYTSYGFSAMIVKPYHLADMAQTLGRLLEVTVER